jgi:hypothetical protein
MQIVRQQVVFDRGLAEETPKHDHKHHLPFFLLFCTKTNFFQPLNQKIVTSPLKW